MKTYTHWEVLVKCNHCEEEILAGHHDYFASAIKRRNQLIESFGKYNVKIVKKIKNL